MIYELDDNLDELPTIILSQSPKKNNGSSTQNSSDTVKRKTTQSADAKSKKQKKLQENLTKEAAALNNIYKPAECMKHMYVEMHSELAKKWYMADVDRELCGVNANLVMSDDICDERLVMWSRKLDEQHLPLPSEECNTSLLVIPAADIATLVQDRMLSQHVSQVALISTRNITLVVFGAKDYIRSNLKKRSTSFMSSLELEMAFTDLLITSKCDAIKVETPNELAMLIAHTTKAIAEAPHKKAKHASDEKADFFMRGDNKKCVAVDPNGVGVSRVWQQMLAVLPQSGLEAARSLTMLYKSPLSLYEELSKEDSITKLAEVGVTRAAVPEARARRIGPEFAKRLHQLFTSDNGDELIG